MKKSFTEFEREINNLWSEGKTEEAVEKLHEALEAYPDKAHMVNGDLAVINMFTGDLEETKKILLDALEQDVVYPKVYFQQILEDPSFKTIFDEMDRRTEELNKASQSEYLVFEPANYSKDKSYPLFIAIHGWGEDAAYFSKFWTSQKLHEEFILVLPQSSQRVGTYNYAWDDTDLAYEEIEKIYHQLQKDYTIDTDQIIVGGFSQGATLALDMTLKQSPIPAKGFISLCPDKPEIFNEDLLRTLAQQGVKGCILTGDKDFAYEQQQEMIKTFKDIEFPHEFFVTEGLGHWFPEDLSDKIDGSINFIRL